MGRVGVKVRSRVKVRLGLGLRGVRSLGGGGSHSKHQAPQRPVTPHW